MSLRLYQCIMRLRVIRSTIESLLAQTHKIDIVVINDNSTDDTVNIVRSIAATNNILKFDRNCK